MTAASILVTPAHPGYPPRLVGRVGTPAIHVRGVLPDARPSVAIVGARAASRAGMLRAHAVARHLAERAVHVVSGGALGIDGAAHRGTLAGGGTTTVVLGCGVDVAYPARHATLFAEVLATGGALISLLADGSEPRPSQFPRRNTVIAALADVVVIVEAQLRSGSLSTARCGRQLGRVVAAFPGSPGCDRLLADGAAIVAEPEDVSAALTGRVRYRVPPAFDPITTAVRDARDRGVTTVDALVRHTGLAVRAVLRALSTLELAGELPAPASTHRSAHPRRAP